MVCEVHGSCELFAKFQREGLRRWVCASNDGDRPVQALRGLFLRHTECRGQHAFVFHSIGTHELISNTCAASATSRHRSSDESEKNLASRVKFPIPV